MLQYTKGTLKAALTLWNRNSAPQFVAELDHIVQRAEIDLFRALNLAPMLATFTTSTADASSEVFKPPNMLVERALWVTVGSARTPVMKRDPAWIKLYSQTPGTPLYYAEKDTTRWDVAPPALDQYLVEVDGEYAFESLIDGNDNGTSFFSTTYPVELYLACAIQACEFLKFWDHKAQLQVEFGAKVAILRGDNAKAEKTDGEDNVTQRTQQKPVKAPGA